jgi:hypothetical protein
MAMANRNFRIRIALLVCLLFALGGCSHFDREWRAAGERPWSGIDGRWQGSWKSEQDGHTGALLCVIRQTGSNEYSASFNATYASMFHFTYDAQLAGNPLGNLVHLTGSQDLGWPVGVYHYDGTSSPAKFYCAYRSKDDHGYFAMARPGGTPPTGPLLVGTK